MTVNVHVVTMVAIVLICMIKWMFYISDIFLIIHIEQETEKRYEMVQLQKDILTLGVGKCMYLLKNAEFKVC